MSDLEEKTNEKTNNFLEATMITINARGTIIKVPYDVLKKSGLVKTWVESQSQNNSNIVGEVVETKISDSMVPELYVNFSSHDVNLFLDYISYGIGFDEYSHKKELIVARLCTYFCYSTNLSPNNNIIVTNFTHSLNENYSRLRISIKQNYCDIKKDTGYNSEYETKIFSFGCVLKSFRQGKYFDKTQQFLYYNDKEKEIIDEINKTIRNKIKCPNDYIGILSNNHKKILMQIGDIVAKLFSDDVLELFH
jgi:hypothetical protein